ncbi:MAG: glycosyltransferase, partial [Lachnospiraceae bacterium]|nr:glycosyltransferase [Lachnospiraceae bacterium]
MEHISIIVPIYHGTKYIDGMIAQIERCAATDLDKYALELLFINDDPAEPIGARVSEQVIVKVIETDINRGIHGARIRGLEHCTGDCVLFLDQDDRIWPEYFSSQLCHLGEADAVVCKLLHEGRQYYDMRMPFAKVITKEFILSVRNPIISPGQVLLRKKGIPEAWKGTGLKNNGADDWLLWLCMLGTGAEFALNPEILFEHVVEGSNESINAAHMIASEQEIYDVAASTGIFLQEELVKLKGAVQAVAEDHIRVLSKFQKMFFIYDDWMKQQEQGRYIHEYLQKAGVGSVAIYGDSYIGKRLYCCLQKKGVVGRYVIDRTAATV